MSPKNATLPRTRRVVWSTTAEFAHQLDLEGDRLETTLTQNDVGEEHDRNAHERLAVPPSGPRVCFQHERGRSIVQGRRNREREKSCRPSGTRQCATLRRLRSDCSPFKGPLITVGSFPRRALRRRGSNMLLLLFGCCFRASTAPAAASVVSDDVGLRCFSPSAAGLADGPMVPARVGSSGSDPDKFGMLRGRRLRLVARVLYLAGSRVATGPCELHDRVAAKARESAFRICSGAANRKRSPDGGTFLIASAEWRWATFATRALAVSLSCTPRFSRCARMSHDRLSPAARGSVTRGHVKLALCLISSKSARSISPPACTLAGAKYRREAAHQGSTCTKVHDA